MPACSTSVSSFVPTKDIIPAVVNGAVFVENPPITLPANGAVSTPAAAIEASTGVSVQTSLSSPAAAATTTTTRTTTR